MGNPAQKMSLNPLIVLVFLQIKVSGISVTQGNFLEG